MGGYALVALELLLISLPLLREMTGPHAPKSGLAFEVPLTGSWLPLTPFKTYFGSSLATRLLDLPVHYFLKWALSLSVGWPGCGFSGSGAMSLYCPFSGWPFWLGLG
ncbi:MAG: hypothetical protein HC875_37050 [Anaerolineales bacterium]|nr:hypothetical protein [Anaerolineales bacterium]